VAELKKVLHIEDEADIREITGISLETLGGLTVEHCASGREALACAVGFAPDLLLIDVMMPGLSGPETLAELRKFPQLQHVPVIFMTAKVQASEIEALNALDIIGIVTKPFDPVRLPAELTEIWGRAMNRTSA